MGLVMACRFRAYMAGSFAPVAAEIYASEHCHGHTPLDEHRYLEFELGHGTNWFAMMDNRRVAHGYVEDGHAVDIVFLHDGSVIAKVD